MGRGKAEKVEGVSEAPSTSNEGKTYVAAQNFRDTTIRDKYIVYKEGEVVHFEGKRLAELIEKGVVKEVTA